jgi:parallel beta-helix repeat protein
MSTISCFRTAFASALVALALFTTGSAAAMDAVVPTDFATISAAIAGATDVDLNGTVDILVMDGVYAEDLVINRSDLVLMGASAAMTVIQGSGLVNTLRIDGADNVTVQGVTLSGAATANVVSLLNVSNCTLQQNIIENGNTGVSLRSTTATTIADNELRGNRSAIKVRESNGNTVSGNDIHDQVKHGIVVRLADDNFLDLNLVTANAGHGIRVRDAVGTIVSGNTITSSGRQGMRVRESTGTTITGNTSSSNGRNGLRMRDTQGSLVSMNTFTLNQEFGVRRRTWTDDDFDGAVEGVQDPAGDNDLSGNVLGELQEDN